MISTPSSFIPRAINSKVNLHILGKSLNLFEVIYSLVLIVRFINILASILVPKELFAEKNFCNNLYFVRIIFVRCFTEIIAGDL